MTPHPAQQRHRTLAAERALWFIVASMAFALVLFGVVLWLIGAELHMPPLWMLLVVIAATIAAWLLVVVSPVPGSGRGTTALSVVQPVVLMRISLLEAPAIVALIFAFLAEPTNLTIYVIAALFALGGMWLFARPSVVRARVERDLRSGQPRSSL
jgi:hypothetical protein